MKARLAIDPQADEYRVKLPPILAIDETVYWSLVKLCVDKDGAVQNVTLIKRAHPAVDASIVKTLGRWRYHPYQVSGKPVPFCTHIRYEVKSLGDPHGSRKPRYLTWKEAKARLETPLDLSVPSDDSADVLICVSSLGDVTGVRIKNSSRPDLDAEIERRMQSAKFKPHLVKGAAAPFCTGTHIPVR